jgi:hypothetical protein
MAAQPKKRPAAKATLSTKMQDFNNAVAFQDKPGTTVTKAVTPLKLCCLCGSNLHVAVDQCEYATVITTNGVSTVRHYKKRCNNSDCRKTHAFNYIQVGRSNVNTLPSITEVGEIIFVSGKFGFSIAYLEQFWRRVVRCSVTTIGEAEALNDYWDEVLSIPGVAVRTLRHHLQSAVAYVLRLRDITSGAEKQFRKDYSRKQAWYDELPERYHFDIEKPMESSPLCNGDDLHFTIYSAMRDNPELDLKNVKVVITDGNNYCNR